MLKARHNKIIYNFFKWYAFAKMKRHFNKIDISGRYSPNNLPMLLICNHISWWDGFWAAYLNQNVFKKTFHFMMLENQLKKHWYFNFCGGFSINKKSLLVIESLKYAASLLNTPNNLVLMFPQGEIQSGHNKSITFEKGAEYILKLCESKVQLVLMACFTDYFSNPRPTLNIYYEQMPAPFEISQKPYRLEQLYNQFYQSCLEKQTRLKE